MGKQAGRGRCGLVKSGGKHTLTRSHTFPPAKRLTRFSLPLFDTAQSFFESVGQRPRSQGVGSSRLLAINFLHAMAVDTVLPSSSVSEMSVPLPSELISKVPPSCRILSRIPLIPTPAVPIDSISDRFSSGMPLPLSSTSRRTFLPEREIRILAT